MKIFWSWQSDHDGKISRHLIRDALRDAIKILKDDPDITEPSEREVLDELYVDQDRQNVAGSPDLANTILEKISSALVVVADVTPVARGKITTEHPTGRGVMNPNVAIELGYALGKLSTNRVLMVLNEHFGKRSDLPFDLQHKAGPISYHLSPEASLEDQKKEQSKLTGHFVTALRLYVVESQTSSSFAKAPLGANDFVFFPAGAPMAEGGLPGFADPFDYLIDPYSVLSVRCFPLKAQSEFSYTELSRAALKLSPLSNTQSGLIPRPKERDSRELFKGKLG